MELWRIETNATQRPKVLSGRNFFWALVAHIAFFAFFFVYSVVHGLFHREETIVPIDLSVIVVENLDGNEEEPPPLEKPEPPPPPPPKPKPKPKVKEPEKPKELEKIVTNIVTKVEKKEEKKPEAPKKTKAELLKERIDRMRHSTTKTTRKPDWKPQPNGRTDKKTLNDDEVKKWMALGAKAGRTEQLATSEEQRCVSLIRMAFEAKWDTPPWTDTLKPMVIECRFGPGGRLLGYRLTVSSGDRNADQTILSAASRVGSVPGLSAAFIEKYKSGVEVRFKVKPQ